MNRRTPFLIVVPVFAVGVAAFGVNTLRQQSTGGTVTAAVGSISRVVVATGRVEPVTEVVLANKIPGRVQEVRVKEGESVRVGQPVILFDDQEYVTQVRMMDARVATAAAEVKRAQRALDAARARWREAKSGARTQEIERARAELDQAEQKYQNAAVERGRQQRLLDGEFVARSQYDAAATEAEVAKARRRAAEESLKLLLAGPKPETVDAVWAQVQEAEAELQRAERQAAQVSAELEHARAILDTTIVQSTLDGKVIKRLVEPGEAVDIGIPLMILGDVGKTIVKAEVDETDVGKLALDQPVEITADAYPGRVFRGKVVEIGQAVGKRKIRPDDPKKIQDLKVLETKVEVTEGGADLKLGMTVDVKIVAAHKERALVIPRSVVPAGVREAAVRVIGPDGPEARRIKMGLGDDSRVEVIAGLSAGDRVIIEGVR